MLDIKDRTIKYLLFTLFIITFSLIYEIFSFGVYSIFMILAFTMPLLGLIINFIIYKFKIKYNVKSLKLLDLSIITLTIGSILQGVLDIYGTTNYLIYFYLVIGILLLILSIIFKVISIN